MARSRLGRKIRFGPITGASGRTSPAVSPMAHGTTPRSPAWLLMAYISAYGTPMAPLRPPTPAGVDQRAECGAAGKQDCKGPTGEITSSIQAGVNALTLGHDSPAHGLISAPRTCRGGGSSFLVSRLLWRPLLQRGTSRWVIFLVSTAVLRPAALEQTR